MSNKFNVLYLDDSDSDNCSVSSSVSNSVSNSVSSSNSKIEDSKSKSTNSPKQRTEKELNHSEEKAVKNTLTYISALTANLNNKNTVNTTPVFGAIKDTTPTLQQHKQELKSLESKQDQLQEHTPDIKQRFIVEDVVKTSDKIEDIFSIKKNGHIVDSNKIDKIRTVIDEKDNPEFVWIKQYTKVYNVNDPATTFPIFSNSKYTNNKKRTPKGNSMPLVAPSDVEHMNLSSLN